MSLLEAGIRAEELRQRAIASNMANIETSGYRRVDVRFGQNLAKALKSPGPIDLDAIEPEVYQPNDPSFRADGNNVTMEAEVGDLMKNALRHATYVRLLRKKYSQIEAAISDRT
ncbi:MAG: flagellar basal body rod protein FlgB [Sedimentisphaerales bacterium]|nr:flagellar basal body rod protein FlgB [Sedimentisphaerales bacterium]